MFKKKRSRVLCIGNSITANGGYVNYLRYKCKQPFDNMGIAGAPTRLLRSTFKSIRKKEIYKDLIILGGVNNIIDIKSVTNDLQWIYTTAKENGIRVIALTITPWKGYKTWNKDKQKNTDAVNKWIMTQAKDIDIRVDTYTPMEASWRKDRLKKEFRDDSLHPNSEGQKFLGEIIYKAAFGGK